VRAQKDRRRSTAGSGLGWGATHMCGADECAVLKYLLTATPSACQSNAVAGSGACASASAAAKEGAKRPRRWDTSSPGVAFCLPGARDLASCKPRSLYTTISDESIACSRGFSTERHHHRGGNTQADTEVFRGLHRASSETRTVRVQRVCSCERLQETAVGSHELLAFLCTRGHTRAVSPHQGRHHHRDRAVMLLCSAPCAWWMSER